MDGIFISDIQRYSVHDGSGIRTVVFFKGCPLSCVWCQNPETQSSLRQLLVNSQECIGCGECADICPDGAMGPILNHSACVACGACASVCPTQARQVIGKWMSAQEIAGICARDSVFYENSGGGVTLSGGEALMQPNSAAKLLRLLKKDGFHTAIETSGYAPPQAFKSVLPYLDLLLFDLKIMDAEKHRRYCGKSNEPILHNLAYAAETVKKIVLRFPLVPGFTDDIENMQAIAKTAVRAGIQEIHILPFHQAGMTKWAGIGMNYTLEHLRPPEEKNVEEASSIFAAQGLSVSIGGGA